MLQERISKVQEKIERAQNGEGNSGMGSSPTIIAVSKRQTVATMRQAAFLGMNHFGENYLQEFQDKYQSLKDLNVTWHFIGQLQSKKVKDIVGGFQWIHSVDRVEIAERISRQGELLDRCPNILIQVNIAGEASKGGVTPDALNGVLDSVQEMPGLALRGLMVFPPLEKTLAATEAWCKKAHGIFREQQRLRGDGFSELSMGTSSDFELAVKAGSTMVRLGEVLLGPRP